MKSSGFDMLMHEINALPTHGLTKDMVLRAVLRLGGARIYVPSVRAARAERINRAARMLNQGNPRYVVVAQLMEVHSISRSTAYELLNEALNQRRPTVHSTKERNNGDDS